MMTYLPAICREIGHLAPTILIVSPLRATAPGQERRVHLIRLLHTGGYTRRESLGCSVLHTNHSLSGLDV